MTRGASGGSKGMATNHPTLVRLTRIAQDLEKASTLSELKKIHDVSAAAGAYARAAKLGGDAARYAEEMKVRAEQKAGELLAKLRKGIAGRPEKIGPLADQLISPYRHALECAGVTKQEAARWQRVAAIPKPQLEAYIAECRESKEQITTRKATLDECHSQRITPRIRKVLRRIERAA